MASGLHVWTDMVSSGEVVAEILWEGERVTHCGLEQIHRAFCSRQLRQNNTNNNKYWEELIVYFPVGVRVTARLVSYGQSVRLSPKPLETHDQQSFFSTEHLRSYSLCNILSDEKLDLSFTIAAGLRQRSHYHVRERRDSNSLFQIPHSPNLEGQVPALYPPGIWWPGYTPGSGFAFCRLPRLTGLRRGYSTPSPHEITELPESELIVYFHYILNNWYNTDRIQNTAYKSFSIVKCVFVTAETLLPSRCRLCLWYFVLLVS
jgi:hypothetical protein